MKKASAIYTCNIIITMCEVRGLQSFEQLQINCNTFPGVMPHGRVPVGYKVNFEAHLHTASWTRRSIIIDVDLSRLTGPRPAGHV